MFPAVTSGRAKIGTVLTLPDARLIELSARAGCEWLFIDCEHGGIPTESLSSLLCAAPADVPVLARLPANDECHVKQALDAGCAGIICPRVEDGDTAANLVRWAKYPPVGERSVGIGRAHDYGLNFATYVEKANENVSVVVQIETKKAVDRIDEILKTPDLGGVFIGPYDLSGSLGVAGQVSHPAVQEAIDQIVRCCRDLNVPVGQFFGTEAAFRTSPQANVLDFVAVGLDTAILARHLFEMSSALRATL